MSLEIIRMEIQKRQTRIQSLGSEIMRTQTELGQMYEEENRTGITLGSAGMLQRIQRQQSEIRTLDREIEGLIEKAREEEANSTPKQQLNPLEMLGLSAIMKADGKMSDEQFNEMLERVRSTVGNS